MNLLLFCVREDAKVWAHRNLSSDLPLSCLGPGYSFLGVPGGLVGKESACNMGDLGLSLGWEDSLAKSMDTHSSILAWRIPWTV